MKKTDFACEIRRVGNGFVVKFYDQEMIIGDSILTEETITDGKKDKLLAIEDLLLWVKDFFGYFGSKHDLENIGICREFPQSGEIKYRDEIYVLKDMRKATNNVANCIRGEK
jgi:hypothetical protein